MFISSGFGNDPGSKNVCGGFRPSMSVCVPENEYKCSSLELFCAAQNCAIHQDHSTIQEIVLSQPAVLGLILAYLPNDLASHSSRRCPRQRNSSPQWRRSCSG